MVNGYVCSHRDRCVYWPISSTEFHLISRWRSLATLPVIRGLTNMLFALLLILLSVVPSTAYAQAQSTKYVGYTYPTSQLNPGGQPRCSPNCTGASVSLIVPTFSVGDGSEVDGWLGINSDAGDGMVCTGRCLGQIGYYYHLGVYGAWYELYCSVFAGSGCIGTTRISGITIHPGDLLTLSMTCVSSCDGSASERWSASITNVTTGAVCYVTTSGNHCGTSGSTLNWPLSFSNFVDYVIETNAGVPWAAPAEWASATYTTGLPGSQTIHKTPLSAAFAEWRAGTGGGAGKTMTPSAPLGINNFLICPPIAATNFTHCVKDLLIGGGS